MSATFSRPRLQVSRADKWFYVLSVALLLSSLLAYTYPTLQVVHKVYIHQKIKVDTRMHLEKQNRLKLRYEALLSHAEMENLAKGIGFIVPENGSVIYVRKSR